MQPVHKRRCLPLSVKKMALVDLMIAKGHFLDRFLLFTDTISKQDHSQYHLVGEDFTSSTPTSGLSAGNRLYFKLERMGARDVGRNLVAIMLLTRLRVLL